MNDYQTKLKSLADILASEDQAPSDEVRRLMTELNLEYSEDQIEQLNQVLLALHELKMSKKPQMKQENHH